MSTALIMVEGVLGEHSTIHGFYPIPDGIRLAHSLRSGYRLVLGTYSAQVEAVEHWLLVNGMGMPAFYSELVYRQTALADYGDSQVQAWHARMLRGRGVEVDLVVSSDPRSILQVTEWGFPSLMFINPAYRWAEYRPDKRRLPVPWEDIEAEMTRQAELKAGDPRLSDEEQVERI